MFEIWYEPDHALLRIRIDGFWDDSTSVAFGEALRARSKAILAERAEFDVLSDARGFAVQTPEVANRFHALAERGVARRTAIVVTSALAKMQARRSMESARVRIFGDMDAARAWLDGK